MGWKSKTMIVATVVTLGLGTASWVDRPTTTEDFEQQQREQQVSDLSDSHERERGRYEDDAEDLRNAEQTQKNIPGEPRPELPKLNLPGKS